MPSIPAEPVSIGGWCSTSIVGLCGCAESVSSRKASRFAQSNPWPASGTTESSITRRTG